MSRRSNEVKFKKADEVDANFNSFTAECLKDMESQDPHKFRWDEEDQTLYLRIDILRSEKPQ